MSNEQFQDLHITNETGSNSKRGQEMHVSSEKKEEREVTIEKLEITLKNVKSYNYPAV